MKKNIGLLIDTMNNGGAQRVVSRLSKILNEEYNIYVILFEDTYMTYECYGEIINMKVMSQKNSIPGKIIQVIRRKKRLEKIKKQYKLDGVISFLDSPNFVNILSRNKNCKTIISVRNYSKLENGNTLLGKLTNIGIKLLYNKADKIVSVSKLIANNLIEQYGIDKDKVVTIYNPYDIDNIQNLANELIEPEFAKFMSSGNIIISVGRQMYQKGFWHLIKAFKKVHDINPQSKLIIVGRAEQSGLVKNLVNELNLNKSILLIGYHKNPFKFIKRSNVYVLSSMFEGFPNAMVESMACGCTVIAADCKSGPREILYKKSDINKVAKDIEFADYGVLIPPLNEEENWDANIIDDCEKKLCEAILKVLNNEECQAKFAVKATDRVRDFDYESCKNAFIKIIGE